MNISWQMCQTNEICGIGSFPMLLKLCFNKKTLRQLVYMYSMCNVTNVSVVAAVTMRARLLLDSLDFRLITELKVKYVRMAFVRILIK